MRRKAELYSHFFCFLCGNLLINHFVCSNVDGWKNKGGLRPRLKFNLPFVQRKVTEE